MDEQIQIGDHVRIVNYLTSNKMPVGIVDRLDGAYIYVLAEMSDAGDENPVTFEVYYNEIVKITEQEFFKLILKGANNV